MATMSKEDFEERFDALRTAYGGGITVEDFSRWAKGLKLEGFDRIAFREEPKSAPEEDGADEAPAKKSRKGS